MSGGILSGGGFFFSPSLIYFVLISILNLPYSISFQKPLTAKLSSSFEFPTAPTNPNNARKNHGIIEVFKGANIDSY